MSIFMMVMIGGGIIFIDDKARGLHEGYLVTPITKLELVAGFNISGTIKAVLAGAVITVIGSMIAGVPNPLDPIRFLRMMLVITLTSFALISLMFLLMVRVTDPLLPRAIFGVLNTVLYFPERRRLPAGWASLTGCRPSPPSIPSPMRCTRSRACCSRTPASSAIAGDVLFLLSSRRSR